MGGQCRWSRQGSSVQAKRVLRAQQRSGIDQHINPVRDHSKGIFSSMTTPLSRMLYPMCATTPPHANPAARTSGFPALQMHLCRSARWRSGSDPASCPAPTEHEETVCKREQQRGRQQHKTGANTTAARLRPLAFRVCLHPSTNRACILEQCHNAKLGEGAQRGNACVCARVCMCYRAQSRQGEHPCVYERRHRMCSISSYLIAFSALCFGTHV